MNPSTNILFLCRLCGSKTKTQDRINIFDSAGVSLDINTKITNCLGIDISENDYLPKVLCTECVNNLENFNEFKIKSKKTTCMLQDLFYQQMSSILDDESSNTCTKNQQHNLENILEPELHIETDNLKIVSVLTRQAKKQSSLLNKKSDSTNNEKISAREKVLAFQCTYCKAVFSSHEESAKHVNEVHSNTQKNQEKLASLHEQIRNAVKINKVKKTKTKPVKISTEVLKCNFCPKEYQQKFKLKRHMKIHTSARKYNCTYCEKKFLNKGALKVHIQRHEKRYDYVCNYCGQGVIGKASFEYHVRTKHTKEYPFECTKCDKKFVTKMALKNHDIGVHNDNRFIFSCEICNKTFKTKIYLKSHQKSHEIPLEQRKRFKCTICDAALTTKRSLQHHMITHSGETPYECEICKNRYNSKDGLRIHLLIHSGVKKFICDYCGKAFALKESLNCHRRMHTGEKPFKCNVCHQQFTQRSSLNTHRKKACPGRAINTQEK